MSCLLRSSRPYPCITHNGVSMAIDKPHMTIQKADDVRMFSLLGRVFERRGAVVTPLHP